MDMMKLVAKYEARTSEAVDEVVRKLMEAFDGIGAQFTEKGREDAAQGLPTLPAEAFAWFGLQTFGDPVSAGKIANIMQACYMEGYKAASGSVHEISS